MQRMSNGEHPSVRHCYDYPRPAVTVDIALFHRGADGLEVLLIRRARDPMKGRWALPGGYVEKDEPLEKAAARELEEETGLRAVALRQIAAFGDPGRDPRGHTISVAFGGVLAEAAKVEAADDAEDARWIPLPKLGDLAFDHTKIIATAVGVLFGEKEKD